VGRTLALWDLALWDLVLWDLVLWGFGRCAPAALRRLRPAVGVVLGLALVGAGASATERFDTVVLDAGHGGEDEGARGARGTLEKDLVLDVSRRLAGRLRRRGLSVVMTRDRDVFVPLEQRTALANDARGDLFVSIHANAAEDPGIRGTETYFLALEASDGSAREVAERENRAFRGAGSAAGPLGDPLIALLGDLIATETLRESSEFAQLVQHELSDVRSLRSRGVKQALFVVLTSVQMPAALVEIGFVTSPQDERVLRNAAARERLVEALEEAVLAFGQRYDARRGVAFPASGGQSAPSRTAGEGAR
jgi:N-acetylmuramoyl-L-alanine amidase